MRARDVKEPFKFWVAARLFAAIMAMMLPWNSVSHAGEPRVILLRGWFGVFSTGLDSLAEKLRAKGFKVEVTGHDNWAALVADIQRERSTGIYSPLVLVGHSQGANNAVSIAHSLKPHKIPVDLLVTLAPFLQQSIPANVVHAVNYYQAPGWGTPLVADADFHGKLSNIDLASDLTIFHITIDKSSKIHAEIVREIEDLSRHDPTVAQSKARSSAKVLR